MKTCWWYLTGGIPGGISFGRVTVCSTVYDPGWTGHCTVALMFFLWEGQERARLYYSGRDIRFQAKIKLFVEQLDKAKLYSNICVGAVLYHEVSLQLSHHTYPLTTSMMSVALALTMTVKSWPGLGGSGLTSIDSIWMTSVRSPE